MLHYILFIDSATFTCNPLQVEYYDVVNILQGILYATFTLNMSQLICRCCILF